MNVLAHSVNSLAKLLRVSPKRVREWIRSGELRAVNVSDDGTRPSWRILPEDLEAFLAGRTASQKAAKKGQPKATKKQVVKFF